MGHLINRKMYVLEPLRAFCGQELMREFEDAWPVSFTALF